MGDWKEGDLTANGMSIHYYRTGGEGKLPLVLLHGFTDNGLCWTRVARALEADYELIMLDARGHGLSAVTDGGYAYEDRAADAIGAIRALGLEQVVAWGHSMGAETAAVAAATEPDLFAAVILEDPPWREQVAMAEAAQASTEARRAAITRNRALSIEALVAVARKDDPQWHEDELLPWAASKRQVSPKVAEGLRLRPPWRRTAEAISCPTLLLTADPERGIVTPEVAAEAVSLLAHGQTRQFDAGHSIHRDAFEPVMAAVRAFLGEVGW